MTAMTLEDARRHAAETVKRSKTSFGAGMRILSRERRDAMYAIYAFCREVDDIADEGGARDEKMAGLAEWRREVERVFSGAPQTPTGIALKEVVRRFDLPREEFILVIEGMEMDAAGPVVAPTLDELLAYTRRAAGAVGMLSMPVFGAPRSKTADDFALSLGDALQLTNILRDIEQDAAEGRLYLPRGLLEKHGCPMTPDAIAGAPGLPAVRAEIAELAREKFAATRRALQFLDWRVLRPALLMMGVYERYLDKMTARGWANGQPRVTISKFEKLLIAARWFLVPKIIVSKHGKRQDPNSYIQPCEHEIVGGMVKSGGAFKPGDGSKRIAELRKNLLVEVATSSTEYSVLYRDPNDGRLWELFSNNPEYHGGGVFHLRTLSKKAAMQKYNISSKDDAA